MQTKTATRRRDHAGGAHREVRRSDAPGRSGKASSGEALRRVLAATANAFTALPADAHERLLRGSDAEILVTLAERAAASSATDGMALAKLRGIGVREKLIDAAGGLLDTRTVAGRLGVSQQAIHKKQRDGKLLAISVGNKLGFPAFQLDEAGAPVPELAKLLGVLVERGIGPWSQLRFLAGRSSRLGGRSPMEALRAGDVDQVLRAARAFGEHGAD